ncbi:hypothetical protein [Actinomadura keratinilytica]|jgi:hypothetical protein|uniref:Uncharacterized protein n=1 Tax=Actinomadura keratinilytica TaxID=547461 RepID=A0ABP7YKL1_9ACTN
MTHHHRRGHWVNIPSRRGAKGGTAGEVELLLYLPSGAGGGDGQTERKPSSHASTTTPTRTP